MLAPPADLSASAVAPALKMNGAAGKKPEPKKAAPLFPAPKPWAANSDPDMPVKYVALDLVHPSPNNPRKDFTGAAMDELVETIRERGVIQPITVKTRAKGGYEIIAGERRWRGSKLAKRATIPIIVRDDLDDTAAAELQAIENLTRADLSAIEEATGYQTLLALPGYSMERLENVTGKKRNTIYGKLKLLDCPEDVQEAVATGILADTTAELIGRLKGDAQKMEAAERILRPAAHQRQPLSHREAQQVIERMAQEEKDKQSRQDAVDILANAGVDVLSDEQTSQIHQYGNLTGHVFADDVCARDPQNRKWRSILKGNQDVARLAIVVRDYNSRMNKPEWKGKEIFRLQEANDALKALGLWEAEGSKKAIEREEKRQAKEAEKARAAKVHSQLDEVVQLAESGGPRSLKPALTIAAKYILNQGYYRVAPYVGVRRGITTSASKRPTKGQIEQYIETLGATSLIGLLVEITLSANSYNGEPRSEHLQEALELLRGAGSADVRTEEARE